MMINIKSINPEKLSLDEQNSVGEVNIFQTITWLNFIAELHKAEIVIATVNSNGEFLGYFSGLIINKVGLRVLGSPFRGWLTYFMGFNLLPKASRHEVLEALTKFAFKTLRCQYIEITDPNITPEHWKGLSYKVENLHFYGIDLSKSVDELFANMDSTGRNCIRKSAKNGVIIEEADDINFGDEYYAQHTDVLAKHGLSPTYSLESVRELIKIFLPTGNLLLLRARNSEGICIATGIFLALNKTAVFWGAASWRQFQQLRPNEPLAWYGMRKLKTQGIKVLHFGGKCEHYKEKLGCEEIQLYRLMKTRYQLVGTILYALTSPKSETYRNWVLRRLSR